MAIQTPPMTAEDARTFSAGERVSSIVRVTQALAELARPGCTCEPYLDVFTFNRWRAQGRTVRRGEHGIKLPVIVSGQKTDDRTGETETFRMRRTSAVFCRCQTDALGAPAPTIDPRLAAIAMVQS